MSARVLRWERRPDDRPQELLDAAMAVFAEKGYRNARLEEVAEAAGVTKGTIYHYFATKEELLLRAIERHHERVFGRLEDVLRDATGPASARIRLFVTRGFALEEPGRRQVLALLLQGIAHEAPDAYRRWLATGPVEGWQLLARLIEEGKRSGEFRPDVDSEVAARLLVSGLLLQVVWQTHASAVPPLGIGTERLLDSTVELFLHGLRPVLPPRGRGARLTARTDEPPEAA